MWRGAWARRTSSSRLGHRGITLLATAIGWTLYGINLATSPTSFAQQRGLTLLENVMSLHAWAWLWLTGGALAWFGLLATVRGWEYRPRRKKGKDSAAARSVGLDAFGFVGAVVPPATWAGAYFLSWAVGEYDKGWNNAGVWGVPAVIAMAIATVPPVTRGGPDER